MHPLITGCLLMIAVILCLLSAIGILVARDAYQRLQFCAPVSSVAMPLIALAVWIGDPAWQARIKVSLVCVILALTGAVLTHATARAVRIRRQNGWPKTHAELKPRVRGNRAENSRTSASKGNEP